MVDQFVAELKMEDTGHRLRLDQQMLETGIPEKGGMVRPALPALPCPLCPPCRKMTAHCPPGEGCYKASIAGGMGWCSRLTRVGSP